ncbi:carbohydrate ABC transporter permease [Virgibacillus necropolis]|uniref:Sugar ABC transporter permease n=1 Tax=Virgibacillus necropolis TaxID=163877 RepID=A0A221M9I5_9BACI|nr:carbohydrate ABC transporter permease [Virgibacillus necropolis]ASN04316.1 sugar ABC transporter permease [Virgibacillus necropolis]
MRKFNVSSIIIRGVLLLGVAFSAFPFYWMIVTASRATTEIYSVPPKFTLGDELLNNIYTVFESTSFFQSFLNTLFIAVVSTTLILFFDSLAGYTFAKLKFKGRHTLFVILLSTMMIPGLLNIIPQFIMMDTIGWVGSYKALIIPGMVNAFGIFWIKQYAEGAIPNTLLEAAKIDGCTTFGIYWKIALPILRPSLAFLGLFTFMQSWNDYMWPLIILNDPEKFTLMLELTQLQGLYFTNYPLVITGTLLATIPILIVFFIFSKQLMSGITEGAIKE